MKKIYVVVSYYEDKFDGFVSTINYTKPLWDTGTPKTWKKKQGAERCANTIMEKPSKIKCKVIEITY